MSETIHRISKNTIFLYIRMIVLMIITLYTSRVLLQTLGVDDFGIFSVVGSVTATFYTLRSVFAEAVQRFLNYEKGGGNVQNEIQIFNIAVVLHIIIAILFVILVEVIGLWLLYNKLVIAPERFDAACFVFHLTVVSSMLYILLVPYDAIIIANEKMSVYAWVSIFDGVAKLLIVLALPIINYDHLMMYALLLAIVPLINIFVYFFYCKRFPECKYDFIIDTSKLKEICSFSGWSFAGNLFFSVAHEGLNVLINMFGGVVYNAARNIAYQVKSAVNQVSNNTLLATQPFILQNAAKTDPSNLLNYIVKILRVNFYIMAITCVPLIVFSERLLSIWLVEVPDYSTIFTQLAVFSVLIRSIHGPLNLYYMGMGKIKRMVVIESLIFVALLLVCYFQLLLKFPIESVFVSLCVVEVVIVFALIVNIKKEFGISINYTIKSGFVPCMLISIVSVFIIFAFDFYWHYSSIWGLVGGFLLCMIAELVLVSLFFNEEEKDLVLKVCRVFKDKVNINRK